MNYQKVLSGAETFFTVFGNGIIKTSKVLYLIISTILITTYKIGKWLAPYVWQGLVLLYKAIRAALKGLWLSLCALMSVLGNIFCGLFRVVVMILNALGWIIMIFCAFAIYQDWKSMKR